MLFRSTGSVLVKEGNLVRAGGEPLVVINQVAPIRVRFSLPAADLSRIRRSDYQSLRVWALPVGDSTHAVAGTLGTRTALFAATAIMLVSATALATTSLRSLRHVPAPDVLA